MIIVRVHEKFLSTTFDSFSWTLPESVWDKMPFLFPLKRDEHPR